jgi:hypothetical protein
VALFTATGLLANNAAAVQWFEPLPGLNSGVFVG